jgi:hypothetical protein
MSDDRNRKKPAVRLVSLLEGEDMAALNRLQRQIQVRKPNPPVPLKPPIPRPKPK